MPIKAFMLQHSRSQLALSFAALLGYIAISFILLAGWRISHASTLGGGDAGQAVWFLNWWPWALSHHLNPFHTNFVWYPSGQNLAWTTSVPTLGLLAWPVTVFASPIWSYNILTLLAPALGAWTAFLLFRQITGSSTAALIGGYFFGFSAYETGQLLGHLNLDMLFLIPVLLLAGLQRFNRAISRRTFVGCLGILLALQAGISTEVFATSIFFAAITWGVFLWLGLPEDRPGLRQLAIEVCAAGVVCGLLIAPMLIYIFLGLNHIPSDNSPTQYSTDLLNLVVPTPVSRIGSDFFSGVSQRFTGNASEQGGYLGLPALLLLTIFFIRHWRAPRLRALFAMLIVFVICSLGPWLQIGGVNTGIPLPWIIGTKIPLLSSALPCRFMAFASLATGLSISLFLATEARPVMKLALAGLACLAIVPNPAVLTWSSLPNAPFFDRSNIEARLGKNPNVMIVPYAYFAEGMVWQVQSGMSFTQSGGYLGTVPSEFAIDKWPIIGELLNSNASPSFADDLISFCEVHRVTAILLTPGAPQQLVTAIRGLGWKSFETKGVAVFRVPAKGQERKADKLPGKPS